MTNTTTEYPNVQTSPFNPVRLCRGAECSHRPGASGFCSGCEPKARYQKNRTSDGVATGRTPKMTPEDIATARQRIARFENPRSVAKDYGVSVTTLRRVTKR